MADKNMALVGEFDHSLDKRSVHGPPTSGLSPPLGPPESKLRGDFMTTVKEIQKRLVEALETKQDPSPILKELADQRAKEAAEKDLAEAQKITAERQSHRDKAAKVQEKVKLQGEAIDTFLAKRDSITEALAPIVEQAKELPQLQGECYAQYHDSFMLGVDIRQIPKGYLPDNFSCPMLEMASGTSESYDVAAMALFHLQAGLGFLSSLAKGSMTIPEKPPGDFDGELETDPYPDPPCSVCQHPEREAIDKALTEGVSLRDIATQYGPSKSSLSRHKAHLES
jgi:hypothetical protein